MKEFTENKKYYCQKIDSKIGNDLVKQYHYSKKVVSNTKLHLGIFDKTNNKLVGVLSFGYPMNPKKTPQKIVDGSNYLEMYELNRMAMTDEAPKFTESQGIGLGIKWLKRFQKNIKWLLSYSDGKENNVGIIYQATNWDYLGYFISNSFYKYDHGEYIHSVTSWHRYKERDKTGRKEMEIVCSVHNDVRKYYCKQHIYVFPLCKDLKYKLEKKDYPRKNEEKNILKIEILKEDGIMYYPNNKIIET